jgi:hypothetical protein
MRRYHSATNQDLSDEVDEPTDPVVVNLLSASDTDEESDSQVQRPMHPKVITEDKSGTEDDWDEDEPMAGHGPEVPRPAEGGPRCGLRYPSQVPPTEGTLRKPQTPDPPTTKRTSEQRSPVKMAVCPVPPH